MKTNKKLNLQKLKIESFVTAIDKNQKITILGMEDAYDDFGATRPKLRCWADKILKEIADQAAKAKAARKCTMGPGMVNSCYPEPPMPPKK